jgi:acetoin utilization deacetylase AcuC-like enzyme
MDIIYNTVFLNHDTGMHPENKKRLESLGPLQETDIIDGSEYLLLVHTEDYVKRVKAASERGGYLDAETKTSSGSYEAATKAVGATIMAAERGDFAIVRPPGHHAHPDHSSGFCLFNNIAIAVQKLVNEGKKVLIFDFDGHLGDGTSKIFYNSSQVMYWSIHQYPAFPGYGTENEIGAGEGKGYTINNTLPPKSGDDIFMEAFQDILPVARQFNPDIVAVSAGFDAHQYDLLLDLRLSNNSFYKIGKALSENFNKVFATLEGGYNIQELPKGVFNFLAGFNGKPQAFNEAETTSQILVWHDYEMRVNNLLARLKPYWNI